MLKRFTFVATALAGLAALVTACSGGNPGGDPQPGTEGEAQVSVKGLSVWQIQSMTVTAQPANITRPLTYSQDAGTFNGTLVLPTGPQTLTANGYAYLSSDAGTPDGGFEMDAGAQTLTLVASGTASVEIVANTTTAVNMRIYDQTQPQPNPDLAPLILSLTASSVNATVNQPITLTVDALDLDGDPLTYAWSSNCPGTFSQPNAPSTTWVTSEPGGCNLTVAVTSRNATATDSVAVVVFNGTPDGGSSGGAQVVGEYIPRPEVQSISLSGANLPYASVYRSSPTANFSNVRPNTQYTVEIYINFGTRQGEKTTDLQTTCGGTVTRGYDSCANNFNNQCYTQFSWTTPAQTSTCVLTGRATNDGLQDSFTAGVLVR
jgi:hypothetical protein